VKNASSDTYKNDNFLRGRQDLLQLIEIKRTDDNQKHKREKSRRGSEIDSQETENSSDQSSMRNKRVELQKDMGETSERISKLESLLLKLHNESRKSLKDTELMKMDMHSVKGELSDDWVRLSRYFGVKREGAYKMRSMFEAYVRTL
jgi:hypothetical protein